jgi:hypothetical protein
MDADYLSLFLYPQITQMNADYLSLFLYPQITQMNADYLMGCNDRRKLSAVSRQP